MKTLSKIWLCLLACLFSAQLPSAQPLDSLLVQVMDSNLEIRALQLEYQAAMERAPQVSQLPEPEVGLGVFVLPVETRLGPQWVRVGASQMFPWKGTLAAREGVVIAMARADFERIEALKLELKYQASSAYFQLYELDATQEVLRRSLRIYRALEDIALSRVESGKASTADVLRTQLKIKQLENEIERLDNEKAKPMATLNRLINQPPEAPIIPADTLQPASLPLLRDSLRVLIQGNHPALGALREEQAAARQRMQLNELEGMPSLGLGLDYIFTGNRDDADPTGNGRDAIMPRLSVKVPLYRKKYEAKEREEELRIAALDSRLQNKRLQLAAALEQAYADYRDARLQLQLYDEQLQLARRALDILRANYSNDGARFDELLKVQDELVAYDKMKLKAIVKTHLAEAEVERLIK